MIGVLIKYIEGIDGTNILLLREDDLKKILGHLLSMDPSEMVELDEISMSRDLRDHEPDDGICSQRAGVLPRDRS